MIAAWFTAISLFVIEEQLALLQAVIRRLMIIRICNKWSVKICPASFRETCQWLKFPLNGLRAQSRVSAAVGLLPLAYGPACLGIAFPAFLVKQLHRCDSVVVSSFVRTGHTAIRRGWLLGGIGCSITHQYLLTYLLLTYLFTYLFTYILTYTLTYLLTYLLT